MRSAVSDKTRPRVLVVDDDPSIRLLLRDALEEACDVEVAVDGDAAVVAYRPLRPDIVLLDVLLPGMSGFDTCARIRKFPGGEHVPVLMMTGIDDVESIQEAYRLGAADFVTKPMNYLVVAQRVRYVLRATRALGRAPPQRTPPRRRSANRSPWSVGGRRRDGRARALDRAFVRDACIDLAGARIASAIIAMAQALELGIVAEGVETQEQLLFVREHRCTEVQGYFFSPPLPAAKLFDWVTAYGRAYVERAPLSIGRRARVSEGAGVRVSENADARASETADSSAAE